VEDSEISEFQDAQQPLGNLTTIFLFVKGKNNGTFEKKQGEFLVYVFVLFPNFLIDF